MRFIPTKAHGVIDYLYALALFALPYFIGGETALTAQILLFTAIGVVVYALLTRYELGAARIISMPIHLVVDFALGVFFIFYAWTASGDSPAMRIALTVMGVLALGASLLTKTHSPFETGAGGSGAQTATR